MKRALLLFAMALLIPIHAPRVVDDGSRSALQGISRLWLAEDPSENGVLPQRLRRPAVLYVFFDDRKERPAWLPQNFTDTGAKIGLEFAERPESGRPVAKGPGAGLLARISVWQCELPEAGSITLGPPHLSPDSLLSMLMTLPV